MRRDSSGRGAPMPVEKVVGLALYRWASGCSYRVVGDVFKVGRSTVFEACREVASAIVANLLPRIIKYTIIKPNEIRNVPTRMLALLL